MPNRKPRNGLVTVSISIDPTILELVNNKVNGKSQSEKMRKVIAEGLTHLANTTE
jgi:hypothetical protein